VEKADFGVCILTEAFFPVIGGGETFGLRLATQLRNQGVNVLVVTRRVRKDLQSFEAVNGIEIFRVGPVRLGSLAKYFMTFTGFWKLVQLRKKYDIIYVNIFRVLGVLGVLAAKVLGKKCVLSAACIGEMSGDYPFWEYMGKTQTLTRLLFRLYIWARNRILHRADSFVGISREIEREFSMSGVDPGKVHIVYYGVDTRLFAPLDSMEKTILRSRLGLPGQTIFCYSGKLIRGKGLESLLRVWKKLLAYRTDIHLLFIGAGGNQSLSNEAFLRSFVQQNGVGGTVTFTGYVTNVHEYLQAADYFVFPSENEGLGLAIIEAMATRLPVLATNVGGIPDLVVNRENGYLIPPNNDEELLAAMMELLRNPSEALELAKKAREKVESSLTFGATARAHMDLFLRLLESRC